MTRRRTRSAPKPQVTPSTPDFGQHHDVDRRDDISGGLAGWRVKTRLDSLLASNIVEAAEWQAGNQYRQDVEVGELGGMLAEIGGPKGGEGCAVTSRLDAVGRLRDARSAMSEPQRVAMDGLAADMSWPAVGVRLRCGRDAAQSVAVSALKVLAEHYDLYAKATRIRALHPAGVG